MTAPAIPGDPAALDAAADAVDRAVRALVVARDGVGAHGRAATTAWTGAASSAATATLGRSGTDTSALLDACAGSAPALRAFALELRAAQQQHADAAQHAAAGQALVLDAGSGAPVGVDARRDQGETTVRDADAAMTAARERARIANEAAARGIDAAALHLDGITPPGAPSTTPSSASAGPGADPAAAVGNLAASLGNAALHDPLAVGAVLVGGALTAVSAVGFAGGLVADATGAGAVVGLPVGAASAAGIAAGIGIAGAGLAGITHHALTDRRVQPFQVNEDAPDVDPGPGAPAAGRVPHVGKSTGSDRVREVPSDQAVRELFDELSEDAVAEPPSSYEGRRVRTPDGTLLGLRENSKSGGPTIDAKLPDGQAWKVHRPK